MGDGVIVGTLTAETVGLGPLTLDPVIRINGIDHVVIGLIAGSVTLPALANAVLVDAHEVGRVTTIESATVYVTTSPGAAPQVAKQAPVALDSYDPARFEVVAPPDPQAFREQIQGDLRVTLLALSLVAAIVSVLALANAMLLSVVERSGEIGLRRAMGARRAHIYAQVSAEALVVGVLGGVVGVLGALAAILGITISRHWIPVFDLRLLPIGILAGAIVGTLGGTAASVRAARLEPSEALRSV